LYAYQARIPAQKYELQ